MPNRSKNIVLEPTQEELSLARKLARQGKTLPEIKAALGWTISDNALGTKLRRYSIHIRRKSAHLGDETWLHPKEWPKIRAR